MSAMMQPKQLDDVVGMDLVLVNSGGFGQVFLSNERAFSKWSQSASTACYHALVDSEGDEDASCRLDRKTISSTPNASTVPTVVTDPNRVISISIPVPDRRDTDAISVSTSKCPMNSTVPEVQIIAADEAARCAEKTANRRLRKRVHAMIDWIDVCRPDDVCQGRGDDPTSSHRYDRVIKIPKTPALTDGPDVSVLREIWIERDLLRLVSTRLPYASPRKHESDDISSGSNKEEASDAPSLVVNMTKAEAARWGMSLIPSHLDTRVAEGVTAVLRRWGTHDTCGSKDRDRKRKREQEPGGVFRVPEVARMLFGRRVPKQEQLWDCALFAESDEDEDECNGKDNENDREKKWILKQAKSKYARLNGLMQPLFLTERMDRNMYQYRTSCGVQFARLLTAQRMTAPLLRHLCLLNQTGREHGDMTLQNIMATIHSENEMRFRVIDYGMSTWVGGVRRERRAAKHARSPEEMCLAGSFGRNDPWMVGQLLMHLVAPEWKTHIRRVAFLRNLPETDTVRWRALILRHLHELLFQIHRTLNRSAKYVGRPDGVDHVLGEHKYHRLYAHVETIWARVLSAAWCTPVSLRTLTVSTGTGARTERKELGTQPSYLFVPTLHHNSPIPPSDSTRIDRFGTNEGATNNATNPALTDTQLQRLWHSLCSASVQVLEMEMIAHEIKRQKSRRRATWVELANAVSTHPRALDRLCDKADSYFRESWIRFALDTVVPKEELKARFPSQQDICTSFFKSTIHTSWMRRLEQKTPILFDPNQSSMPMSPTNPRTVSSTWYVERVRRERMSPWWTWIRGRKRDLHSDMLVTPLYRAVTESECFQRWRQYHRDLRRIHPYPYMSESDPWWLHNAVADHEDDVEHVQGFAALLDTHPRRLFGSLEQFQAALPFLCGQCTLVETLGERVDASQLDPSDPRRAVFETDRMAAMVWAAMELDPYRRASIYDLAHIWLPDEYPTLSDSEQLVKTVTPSANGSWIPFAEDSRRTWFLPKPSYSFLHETIQRLSKQEGRPYLSLSDLVSSDKQARRWIGTTRNMIRWAQALGLSHLQWCLAFWVWLTIACPHADNEGWTWDKPNAISATDSRVTMQEVAYLCVWVAYQMHSSTGLDWEMLAWFMNRPKWSLRKINAHFQWKEPGLTSQALYPPGTAPFPARALEWHACVLALVRYWNRTDTGNATDEWQLDAPVSVCNSTSYENVDDASDTIQSTPIHTPLQSRRWKQWERDVSNWGLNPNAPIVYCNHRKEDAFWVTMPTQKLTGQVHS